MRARVSAWAALIIFHSCISAEPARLLPILSVCEVLSSNPTKFNGKTISVRGRLESGYHGTWLAGDCKSHLVTQGLAWGNDISVYADLAYENIAHSWERLGRTLKQLHADLHRDKVLVTIVGRLDTRDSLNDMVVQTPHGLARAGYGQGGDSAAEIDVLSVNDVAVEEYGAAKQHEIAAFASSPFELANFIGSHTDFDCDPLWRALNIHDDSVFLPRCNKQEGGVAPCSSEVITEIDPLQVILVLKHRSSNLEVFLRYETAGAGIWRFSGAFAPYGKSFRPEHQVARFDRKPFLLITAQGNAGTGASSRLEYCFDLTSNRFAPVLTFTSEGHSEPLAGGIWRTSGASIVSVTNKAVTVAFRIDFEVVENGGAHIGLGERSDTIVYVRTATGNFEIDPAMSTATAEQVRAFYEDFERETFSKAELLKFDFKGFRAVATAGDVTARSWLSRFLAHCPETDESRELKHLISTSR